VGEEGCGRYSGSKEDTAVQKCGHKQQQRRHSSSKHSPGSAVEPEARASRTAAAAPAAAAAIDGGSRYTRQLSSCRQLCQCSMPQQQKRQQHCQQRQ
jgi:hypothetical protein